MADAGTSVTPCNVFTSSRVLTNWLGKSASFLLSKTARALTVPVVVSIWSWCVVFVVVLLVCGVLVFVFVSLVCLMSCRCVVVASEVRKGCRDGGGEAP